MSGIEFSRPLIQGMNENLAFFSRDTWYVRGVSRVVGGTTARRYKIVRLYIMKTARENNNGVAVAS